MSKISENQEGVTASAVAAEEHRKFFAARPKQRVVILQDKFFTTVGDGKEEDYCYVAPSAVLNQKGQMGLFAARNLAKGQIFLHYTGRIITKEEAEHVKSDYVMQLGDDKYIDAKREKCLARYINSPWRPPPEKHYLENAWFSCPPNKKFDYIEVVAKRDIPQHQEILAYYTVEGRTSSDLFYSWKEVSRTKKLIENEIASKGEKAADVVSKTGEVQRKRVYVINEAEDEQREQMRTSLLQTMDIQGLRTYVSMLENRIRHLDVAEPPTCADVDIPNDVRKRQEDEANRLLYPMRRHMKRQTQLDYLRAIQQIVTYMTDPETTSVIFFTGAGISGAASIPTYKGKEGLRELLSKKIIPPYPDLEEVNPTAAHKAISALVALDAVKYVVTLNIDNLHAKSGIHELKLFEVHGSRFWIRCANPRCQSEYVDDQPPYGTLNEPKVVMVEYDAVTYASSKVSSDRGDQLRHNAYTGCENFLNMKVPGEKCERCGEDMYTCVSTAVSQHRKNKNTVFDEKAYLSAIPSEYEVALEKMHEKGALVIACGLSGGTSDTSYMLDTSTRTVFMDLEVKPSYRSKCVAFVEGDIQWTLPLLLSCYTSHLASVEAEKSEFRDAKTIAVAHSFPSREVRARMSANVFTEEHHEQVEEARQERLKKRTRVAK